MSKKKKKSKFLQWKVCAAVRPEAETVWGKIPPDGPADLFTPPPPPTHSSTFTLLVWLLVTLSSLWVCLQCVYMVGGGRTRTSAHLNLDTPHLQNSIKNHCVERKKTPILLKTPHKWKHKCQKQNPLNKGYKWRKKLQVKKNLICSMQSFINVGQISRLKELIDETTNTKKKLHW